MKKGNALKANEVPRNDDYTLGENRESKDDISLALKKVSRVYRRGNFQRGRRFSRGNQATSLYKPKCYGYKSTDHLIADSPKLKGKDSRETKQKKKFTKERKKKA